MTERSFDPKQYAKVFSEQLGPMFSVMECLDWTEVIHMQKCNKR